MQTLLQQSLERAMQAVTAHANLVGCDNVDEFTFRSFLLAEIMRREPQPKCQIEWGRRFDLLVQRESDAALAEIKFY